MITICGIVGAYVRDPDFKVDLNGLLDEMLLQIENRGRDATGFVAISDDGVAEWHKAACKASVFIKYRRAIPKGTRLILGHTRFATQGIPGFMENNHPIRRGPYFIVHNGHVLNDNEVFENASRQRYGQVDSEAIAARLSSLGDLGALGKVMEEIRGDAAVAAVDERDPTRLVIAKGTMSPLWVYNGRVIVLFASIRSAIEKAHTKYIGKISESNLNWIAPGTQIEWNGLTMIKTEFVVQESFMRRWLEDDLREGVSVPKKVWSPSDSLFSTPPSRKELPKSTTQFDEKDDDDYLDCENCNNPVHWADGNYRYDTDDRVTWMFCDECAGIWDAGNFEIVDGNWEDVDDDEEDPTDNYNGANQSIIRRLLDHGI